MKNKHGILAALMILALVAGNALLLPKLLAFAQALPEGEVILQPTVAATARVPLPTPPEGFGVPYQLKFSRPLSEEEQKLWGEMEAEMQKDEDLLNGSDGAEVTFTQRAQDRMMEAVLEDTDDETVNSKYRTRIAGIYPIGDGTPETILIDLGTVAVCVGDEPLTREAALPLLRQVVQNPDRSQVDSSYNLMFRDFSWMKEEKDPHYTLSRSFNDDEYTRLARLRTDYLLSGLRPSTPLNTSEPPDGGLWFDEGAVTIHLPMLYELTDDEMLHYIELTDTLTRQALLKKTPDMITQQQATELAKDWAQKLFGMDVSSLRAFVALEGGSAYEDETPALKSDEPEALWRVRFGPEDMLVRENGGDYDYARCEVQIDAASGALNYAYRGDGRKEYEPSKKYIRQVKADLKKKAMDTVQTLFEDGRKPKKAVINTYGYDSDEHAFIQDGSGCTSISYVVSMSGGVEYELEFITVDQSLISYRFWPNGCENMG